VVVSTSYLDEAERCDRVALLQEGRVLAMDTPEALLELLPGRVFSVVGPNPRRARDILRQTTGVLGTALFGNAVHAVVEEGEGPRTHLSHALESAGWSPDAVDPVEPTLEDVFLHLVRGEEAGDA
jgi:ABC-2 type transport system ATP-binding protein